MELIFLGTPQFAVPTLQAVVEGGHHVLAVFTQPDRPSGRGGKIVFSPVKQKAIELGIPVKQPQRIRGAEAFDFLAGAGADAMVVVGYGQIIPQAVIDLPRFGIVNVHASLLPKYRGAAPVQWAIVNGEVQTGVTTMKIDAGLDTGDMLLRAETQVGPEEDAVELSGRLSRLGAGLLVETLRRMEAGTITPEPQDNSEATYAPVLKKEDGLINWNESAMSIHNRVRGLVPWPGAYTYFRGQLLHVWKAKPAAEQTEGTPGTLHPVRRSLRVACGGGTSLELLDVQLEGRKRTTAESFLNGQRILEGEPLAGARGSVTEPRP
ncbi:MAG: methionyl-tRNA formyltransferase [Bryobacteraceae bacterium]|nr:methionyl-tRNA formyltransferase [Bryobacteraceae bacterium]